MKQEITFYRKLTADQRDRIKSHEPTVIVNDDGSFEVHSTEIITPKGRKKFDKKITIIPDESERVVDIDRVLDYFDDLQHVNLIVTNACNLSCSYCYEQHNTDFGQFNPESLKEIYDFQLNCNDKDGKLFQFFGGEPLIHKELILAFCKKYKDELTANQHRIKVSMITNGILLTPEFIEEYFSYSFTNMSISLDTIDSSVDHREIGQDRINTLLDMIELIPAYHKDHHMISIRCTLSIENAPLLQPFATELYARGMRAMVVHPLTMSSVHGFISWPEEIWNNLHNDIIHVIENFPNFSVQFSEGVGVKGGTNCMVGSDMIAVDGTGDYSGCYFFTNQKTKAASTILGNLLHRKVYVDRYAGFQEKYDEMFITEEQCKTCDLKGFCYQCPAGNMDSGNKSLFRPDDMCQKIVKLFIDLQNDIVRKAFASKLQGIIGAVQEEGEEYIFAKAATHLLYKHVTGHHLPVGEIEEFKDKLPPHQVIFGHMLDMARDMADNDEDGGDSRELPCACDFIPSLTAEDTTPVDVKTFYESMLELQGTPNSKSKESGGVEDEYKRYFYLALIHMITLNPKGETLDKPQKNYIERLNTI
jgi:radical SAM protein with 4Fe4S-binding SPASM domain